MNSGSEPAASPGASGEPADSAKVARRATSAGLEALFRQAWEDYESTLKARFPELLMRVLEGMARETVAGEVVLWHLYNAGWVVVADSVAVGMDVALMADLGATQQAREALFGALDALLITHQHADHCYEGDVAVWADLGRPLLVCHPDTARVLTRRGVPEKQVFGLEAGESTTIGGLRVQALPANHRHRDIPNCIAFAATLGGFTIVHTGDNRLFGPPALQGAEEADVLIHSLYAYDEAQAREGALTWVPEMLDEQARFLADLRPRVVLLTHLAEFYHPYHKLWRFVHAALLKERLFHLAPEVECPILGPGERYVYRR